MEKNLLGNEIRWLWTMRKLNTPFSISTYEEGVKMSRQAFGYAASLSATWYDYGDIYFDEEEIEMIRHFIRHKVNGDADYPDDVSKKIFTLAKQIEEKRVEVKNLKNMNLSEAVEYFQKDKELFIRMIGFMSYRGSVQMSDVLTEKLKDMLYVRLAEKGALASFNKCWELFGVPSRVSVMLEEKIYALELASGFSKLDQQKQLVRAKKYLKRYRWISFHWLVGQPPTIKEVVARLGNLSDNAAGQLQTIKEESRAVEQAIEVAQKELGLGKGEMHVVEQYRRWLFLRTFVKDNTNLAGYKLLPVLERISELAGIELKLMPYLTVQEIESIESKVIKELERTARVRMDGISAGLVEGRIVWREFEKPKRDASGDNSKSITGAVAYRGKVKGIVKVLNFPKEQAKLKRGNILVTSMTTPDYLPAMERAAAFVTDEGGITCHAAIVAREMKKPCIIGTKTATQVLKDGDEVEVDADQGVVKIIKRN